ncbi:hypothetical protein DFH09DRAFT_1081530 [Mycena vulgaris]|nr:hypothetical protein DFH09DRAFT_1081530 [Mycena vulgaris]
MLDWRAGPEGVRQTIAFHGWARSGTLPPELSDPRHERFISPPSRPILESRLGCESQEFKGSHSFSTPNADHSDGAELRASQRSVDDDATKGARTSRLGASKKIGRSHDRLAWMHQTSGGDYAKQTPKMFKLVLNEDRGKHGKRADYTPPDDAVVDEWQADVVTAVRCDTTA